MATCLLIYMLWRYYHYISEYNIPLLIADVLVFLCLTVCDHRICISLGWGISTDSGCADVVSRKNGLMWRQYNIITMFEFFAFRSCANLLLVGISRRGALYVLWSMILLLYRVGPLVDRFRHRPIGYLSACLSPLSSSSIRMFVCLACLSACWLSICLLIVCWLQYVCLLTVLTVCR